MKYAIIALSLAFIGSTVYALSIETDPQKIIEKQNREEVLNCMENVQSSTWTARILQEQIEECTKIELKTITWTASGAIVPPPERLKVDNSKMTLENYSTDVYITNLQKKICEKQVNSPLCKDWNLLYRLYRLTEERIPDKQFFPILIGITNAESSLWLDFAKDRVGGTCTGRNNWWGTKYQIHDDNTRTYSRSLNWFSYGQKYSWRFVDQFGCNLYPFESIEEYFITKINWIRFWYKWCIDSKTPIRCLSFKYVWDPNVSEQSWVNNVAYFIE